MDHSLRLHVSSDIVPDPSPILRVADSIAFPPIGSVYSSLRQLPSNMDTAHKAGCGVQSYTSWNVSSRSFVSAICYKGLDVEASATPIPTSVCSTGPDVNVRASCSVQTQKQTSLIVNSTAPPAELSTWYSDTLPVRVVNIQCIKPDYERNIPIPYSPLFKSMENMLADPTILEKDSDGESIYSERAKLMLPFAEYLQTICSEMVIMFEVAPLVRLGCMSLSISKQCYETEIITRRIIRGYEQSAYFGCEITQETRRTPVSYILACTLKGFTEMSQESKSMDPDNIYQGIKCDGEWTAVPISNQFVQNRSAVPYIASFLTSEFYNGKVNHVYNGYYSNAEGTRKTEAVIRTIPAANSVYLNGPKNIILVLVDASNSSNRSNVKLLNFNVPIYTGATQVKPVQFGQIWDAWWCNSMLHHIERDVQLATREVENHLAVRNAADIATSMLAELYSAAYLGIAVEPNQENMTYNWQVPVSGGWSLYHNDKMSPGSNAKLNFWSTADGDDQIAARRRITGYNFSALTSWHRPSTGVVNTESQASIFPNAGQMRIWSTTVPVHCLPGYSITTLDSVIRLCFYVKLLLAHETRMNNNCIGSRIHLLSMVMGAQTSLIFSQTNLSLSVWSGYSVDNLRIMEKVLKIATLGISSYSHQLTIVEKYGKDAIIEYYAMDPFKNVNWYSYTPYPHLLVQQWSSKINTLIGNYDNSLYYITSHDDYENIMGILLSKDTLQYRSKLACTLNTNQYFPMVVYSPKNIMAWVDNWSYLSNISVNMYAVVNKANLASNELVLPMVRNRHSSRPEFISYIVGSSYVYCDPLFRETSFSGIKWHMPNHR